ncbi:hypothetical protein DBR32_12165 [Taibaiella sp. KBW10]|uniref:hypothetical protein n=1 Tax=Taibaiella sp. KBW10 TaxID=2153357 RepID=UPI000F5A1DD3|nr:hypothetical protein [Taibaiella sp. KBW10]RQO30319.1 hypothetical protein DBR32_12165 [Taibaiella sp. KBW10]
MLLFKSSFRSGIALGLLCCFPALPVFAQQQKKKNTVIATASFKETDRNGPIELDQMLHTIRANFKRINSMTKWTTVRNKALDNSSEGGTATFYYQQKRLEKIITRAFGEMTQNLTEYYFLNGEISFVLERTYQYNRPYYYDVAAMKANNDTAAFDFNQSEIEETRSYFEQKKLIYQLNNQDCGAPFASDYLDEERIRIESDIKTLLKYVPQ